MSNPYNQFNIRPQRSRASFWADQADAVNSRLNGLTFPHPAAGPRRLQSPAAAYDNQRLYNAMYTGTPVMQMDPNTDFSSLGSAAFDQWMGMQYQRYMANCNSGVPVVPVIPFSAGNQTCPPHWPANISDATAMMHYMAGRNAVLLQNQMPVLPPENLAVQQARNMPAFPAISIVPSSLNPADSLPMPCDTNIPFRQVQWIPPAAQKSPYTVENKPDCKTEIAGEEAAPSVYVDIAADGSTRLEASDRSGDMPLIDSNVIVVQPVENTGKRKGNQLRSKGREKVKRLSDKYSLKPCAVRLVPVDTLVSDCHESDVGAEESSDIADAELTESGDDLSPQPEVSEPKNNLDFPVPVALYASPMPEFKEMLNICDISAISVLETEDACAQTEGSPMSVSDDASPLPEAQELLNNHNVVPVPAVEFQDGTTDHEVSELTDDLTHSTGPVPQVQNSQAVTLPDVQENTDSSPLDQLIGNDEDVGEDFSHDDGDCLQNENENASTEQSLGYKVMLSDSDGLLFDMECDDDKADETLRVMLPSKTLKTTCEKTGSANTSKTVSSPTKTYVSASEHLLADVTKSVLLLSRGLETSQKSASASTGKTAPVVPRPPKISIVANLHKLLTQSKSKSKPVRSIVVDDSEDSDNDVVDSVVATSNTISGSVRSSTRLAASACKEKISATIEQECIDVEENTEDVEISHAASTTNPLESAQKKTGTAASMPTSKLRETIQSKQLHKTPTGSDSDIVTIDLDLDDSDDVVIISSNVSTANSAAPGLQHLPAVARNEKSSAKCKQHTQKLKHILIKESVNCFLDVPLHSSFFRFEAQSSEVFRLLSMDKSCVPVNVLSELTDLIASVDADDGQVLLRDASHKVSLGIGGSRTLLFQCLFCPYAEMSAKRVMVHVKQQHRKHASFMQRSLLPSSSTLLYIYCRHCNFVTYDSAALFIHFAVYHRVPGILFFGPPKDIEDDPDWAPVFNRQALAKEFPFYCCPNCDYIDNEWSRIIQHVLKQHFSKSVFLGCIVKLFMVSWATNSWFWLSMAYGSLAKEPQARTEIYACISCRFFSFYPSQTFCHYLVSHRSLTMLYVCAGNVKRCSKQFTSVENVISHMQADHASGQRYQLRCTVTLCDSVTATELHISSGYLVPRDVPVHVRYRSSSASVTANSEAAIEIVDDDDSANDDGVIILQADPKDNETNDVEPDSTVSEGCNDCIETAGNDDPSSESVSAESDDKGTSDSCSSSQERDISEVVAHCGEETVAIDNVPGVGNETSAVNVDRTPSNVMDAVCTENLHVTEPLCEQNKDDNTTDVADLVNHETLIPTNSKSFVASAVCQVDSLLMQEETLGTEPALNDVYITDQELLASTGPDSVEPHNERSSARDNTLYSSELPKSPSSPTESRTHSVDLQEELLLLAEGLASDDREPQDQLSKMKHTVSTSSIFSDDESHIIGVENPCFASLLDTSDDAICSDVVENEQSHSYVDSLPKETDDAKEQCGETSVLLPFDNDCNSDIPVESAASVEGDQIDLSVEQRSGSDIADKPVSTVKQARFKLLAGYRFPARSVLTKPS